MQLLKATSRFHPCFRKWTLPKKTLGRQEKVSKKKTFNESEPEANHGAAAVLMDQISV